MINILDEVFNEYIRSLDRTELLRLQKYIWVGECFFKVSVWDCNMNVFKKLGIIRNFTAFHSE